MAATPGYMTSSGLTIVADGTPEAAYRLEYALTTDTGLGVLRYADAGYPEAAEAARTAGLRWVQLGGDGDA